MKNKNMMMGTLALGAAAYMLRNKESRDKVMTQVQSLAMPENIEKIKNLPFLSNDYGRSILNTLQSTLSKNTSNNGTSYKDQTIQKGASVTDRPTSYKEDSLLGTDFAQKEEDDTHSLAEAPKLL
ncbi:hypothetical protein [Bacillus sp. V5-8f]|uniref:hypothetical protein n=1 Tax=Bacillus sp. V5-8f TaxID=2053044 RepID=UPI000C76B63D|nr:hypothetical protein [Bacillus sp. V5-8f]PLT35446.1 hypothetical protein CUU64_02205 [Bacillus sp. V5-8f]